MGFAEDWIEKRNDAHAEAEELEEVEPPELPGPWKPVAASDADAIVGDREGDHETLADAIERVEPGGVIHVRPGVYRAGKPIETRKTFSIVGAGAATTVLLFAFDDTDDGLALLGEGTWKLSGIALLADSDQKSKDGAGDLVSAQEGSRVELYRCVIAGAPAKVDDEDVTTGGCGVRAHGGSGVKAVECLFAFNHWNAAAHDGGAELELEGCQIFGAQFGVFAGAAGVVRMRGGRVRRNLYGLKLFGEGARLEATDVAIVDQTKNGVFVEAGSATLQGCQLVDNGSHGIGAAAGTDVIVTRCTVSENWESGLYVDGSCRIEESEICDNGEHAVVLESESRGTVRNNRCHENGGYGIVRDPASQAEIADNRTQANERDGLYTFGTLADQVAAAFPKGVALPEGVKQLARFQEETGRLAGETLYVAPGPLAGWPGLESEFAVFGTGPDGSTIAYWLRDGLPIERAPIVYLDSEGVENFVLARTFEELLSILATGRDDLRWGDDVEPEIDDEDELETLVEWMKETFDVEPAESIDAIRAAAVEAHPGLSERLEASRPS